MMQKVLHVCSEKSWRGGENQTFLLAHGLLSHDVQSFFACVKGSEIQKKVEGAFQVCEVRFSGLAMVKSVFDIADFCDKHQIQVMDAQSSKAHALGLLVKMVRPGIRLVVHRRVDYPVAQDVIGRLKYLSPKVDRYIAISNKIKKVLTESGVSSDKVQVVRSAVSSEPYLKIDRDASAKKWRDYFHIADDQLLVLTAAAISEQKALDVHLRSVALLTKEERQKFHFVIAGTGPLLQQMKDLAASLNLGSSVTFAGFVEDIKSLIVAADLFFLTSRDEGLGTSLLEAALARTCIIASNAGGIPEIVVHKKTGMLFENENSTQAKSMLLELAQSSDKRARYSAEAYHYVEEQFCVEKMILGNLEVYQTVIV